MQQRRAESTPPHHTCRTHSGRRCGTRGTRRLVCPLAGRRPAPVAPPLPFQAARQDDSDDDTKGSPHVLAARSTDELAKVRES
jgi:hypothetical protein